MKLTGLVNGNITIAANNMASLIKKANSVTNRELSEDTLLVEGLDGKTNRPVLFTRFNKRVGKKTFSGLWMRS